MKIEEVKKYIELIEESDVNEIEIGLGEEKYLRIVKHPSGGVAMQAMPQAPMQTSPEQISEGAKKDTKSDNLTIKAPIVGTFYRKPSPDDDPYVSVGQSVEKGQVVCLIEAMKIFNEIKSTISGKIVNVLIEDGQPVEYDQPLFEVE
jgi:acetyl-CoA carboxylase biotin carboxyl carrier protein